MRDPGSKEQGVSQAKGVRQFPGQRQRLVGPLQGLVGIAKKPQGHSSIGSAYHPRVLPIAEGMSPVPPEVVEMYPLREMGLGSSELSQVVQGVPEGIVGLQEKSQVSDMLGQGEEVLPELTRRP